MNTLQGLLLACRMTKAEKQIAEYWLAHRQDAGYLTMRKLADRLIVSDMTVLWFVRKLGFDNYAEFVRDYLRENTESAQRTDLVSAVCSRGAENFRRVLVKFLKSSWNRSCSCFCAAIVATSRDFS